jgi:hypothetical protein
MLEKYISYLFKQYCDAKGLDISRVENVYSEDFMVWIKDNKELLEAYEEYLRICGINFEQEDLIEIGKGKYDSLMDHGVSIITPYASTMGKEYSRLMISEGTALEVRMYGISKIEGKVLLTHNPYFSHDVANWPMIHNRGINDISIGVFGSIQDEDYKKRIELLTKLSKKMTDDYVLNYDTCEDKYFCTLNSKRKVNRKIKIRG